MKHPFQSSYLKIFGDLMTMVLGLVGVGVQLFFFLKYVHPLAEKNLRRFDP